MGGRGRAAPVFALYGEPSWSSALDTVHVESLASRARLHNWTIREHSHDDLHQIFWLAGGEGVLQHGGGEAAFGSRTLINVPAGAVHAFRFEAGAEGHVLTLSAVMMARVPADSNQRRRWAEPRALDLSGEPQLAAGLDETFARLDHDFRSRRPGRELALTGEVMLILAALDRALVQATPTARDADGALVARFRVMIEERYPTHAPLEDYCRDLGVSSSRLTRACRTAAGRSPLDLVHDRMALEAKRNLAFTAMSVSEVAYGLGFSDPAYFSRFFQKREGASPREFRRQARALIQGATPAV